MVEKFHSTPIGVLHLVVDDNVLVRCKWHIGLEADNGSGEVSGKTSPFEFRVLEKTVNEIDLYLEGKLKSFSIPLRLSGTSFQEKVWQCIRQIPYGETVSYGELAKRVGSPKGQRAVARACGANPIGLIVPCHRVVGSNRILGGYTGGIEKKIFLLNLEKADL